MKVSDKSEHFEKYIDYSDEELKEIISKHSRTYATRDLGDQCKLAFDILQWRSTKKLVHGTWALAIFTIILSLATIAVAIGTFLLVYFTGKSGG